MNENHEVLTDDEIMRVVVSASDSLNITRIHELGEKTRTIMDEAGLLETARAIERAVLAKLRQGGAPVADGPAWRTAGGIPRFKPKPDASPVADELPHWEEVSAKLRRNETLTPLELFIHENEPGGDAAAPWRDQLDAALASAPVADELEADMAEAFQMTKDDRASFPASTVRKMWELKERYRVALASAPVADEAQDEHVSGETFTRGWINLEELPGVMMIGPGGRFGPIPASKSCWITTSEMEVERLKAGGPVLEIFTRRPPPAPGDAQDAAMERLHAFLDSAAGEGVSFAGIDADQLYVELFPDRYAAAIAAQQGHNK